MQIFLKQNDHVQPSAAGTAWETLSGSRVLFGPMEALVLDPGLS